MRIVVLLGAPGVGKGTAAQSLVRTFGFRWLSTGELLRGVQRSGSELGQKIAGYIDHGRLVPDPMIIDLVHQELLELPLDAKLLFDGFPRTVPQAVALDEIADGLGSSRVELVLEMRADEEEIVERILGRGKRDGRADDTFETLQSRLRVYQELTAPLIHYYEKQEKIEPIDAMGTPSDVAGRINQRIRSILRLKPQERIEEAG